MRRHLVEIDDRELYFGEPYESNRWGWRMSDRKARHDRPANDFKDPVCGMEVSRNTAAAVAEFRNETYFFCSPMCRDRFLEEPEKYVHKESGKR